MVEGLLDGPVELHPGAAVAGGGAAGLVPAGEEGETGAGDGGAWGGGDQVEDDGGGAPRRHHLGEVEGEIVHPVVVDLSPAIELVPGSPLKLPPGLPWNPGNSPEIPADEDDIVGELPNPQDVHGDVAEEHPAMEAQSPEDQPIIVDAMEGVKRVGEGDVGPAKEEEDEEEGEVPEVAGTLYCDTPEP